MMNPRLKKEVREAHRRAGDPFPESSVVTDSSDSDFGFVDAAAPGILGLWIWGLVATIKYWKEIPPVARGFAMKFSCLLRKRSVSLPIQDVSIFTVQFPPRRTIVS